MIDSMIKGHDNNKKKSIPALRLIIKGLHNQVQKLNNQINQYPKKA